MKKLAFILLSGLTLNSFGQLTNTIPDSGPVGIGTGSPEPGKQLTVDGPSKFQSSVEVDGNVIFNEQTRMTGIVRIDSLDAWSGELGDMEIVLINEFGQIQKTNVRGLVAGIMHAPPAELDWCGGVDSLNPSWFNGPNKIFSPCPDVNVGIGNSNPKHKLDVSGQLFSMKFLVGNSLGSNPAMINAYAYNNTQQLLRLGKKIGGLDEQVRLTVDNDGAMTLTNVGSASSFTINNGTGHAVVVNNNEGNKIFQIQNSGLVRARRIKVDSDDWADYVFAKDYNLLSLRETERFILENGHLPNVPDAYQIESNGLDLGEMQKIQMEKIEELTLHLIEMDKRMTELKQENESLKSQIEKLKK